MKVNFEVESITMQVMVRPDHGPTPLVFNCFINENHCIFLRWRSFRVVHVGILNLFSTRKPAASAFKYCDWMKVLAASLRVGFCDEWKRVFN